MDVVVHGRYVINSIIGQGKFGIVFKSEDNITGEQVAIKRECSHNDFLSIKHETKMMTYLFQNRFRKLPFIYWYGSQDGWQYLVMTYYECSLESFLHTQIQDDNIKVILNVFLKCICLLEDIHKLYVLHRDIKPDNFMVKSGSTDIHLIDYGLSNFYIDGEGRYIINSHQEMITGTPKYVSYYNCIGNTISRRDDLISLGYMFIYFLYGYLPWQGMQTGATICKKWSYLSDFLKNESPIIENIPIMKVYYYMEYCYSLEFEETPKYNLLKQLFIQ